MGTVLHVRLFVLPDATYMRFIVRRSVPYHCAVWRDYGLG
jgi:hypothetical protein